MNKSPLYRPAVLVALVAIVMGFCAQAQVSAYQSHLGVAANPVAYSQWRIEASGPVLAPGSASIQLEAASTTLPDGTVIHPIQMNSPLLVLDGSNSEIITPTAVQCTANQPSACILTAVFQFPHPGHFAITSGSDGLQEAIDDTASRGGGEVILAPDWQGSDAQMKAATGFSNVAIEDRRQGAMSYLVWRNGTYSSIVHWGSDGSSMLKLENVRYADQFSSGQLSNPSHPPIVAVTPNSLDTLHTPAYAGTIPAGTYSVVISYFNGAGETLPSPAATVTTSGNSSVLYVANNPGDTITGGTEGYYVYVSYNGGPYVRACMTRTAVVSAAPAQSYVPGLTAGYTTSTSSVTPGNHTVTPASMASINYTTYALINGGRSDQEVVQVTGTTATGFTATFTEPHSSNFTILPLTFVLYQPPPANGTAPSTSNTAAISGIQQCINDLPISGGTCVVPAGVYDLNTALILWHDDLRLRGDGPYSTTLRMTGTDDVVRAAGAGYPAQSKLLTGIIVSDLQIDGNSTGISHNPSDTYENGINFNDVRQSRVSNVWVHDAVYQGIIFQGDGNADAASGNLVDHNWVSTFGEYGIGLEGGDYDSAIVANQIFDGATIPEVPGGAVGIIVRGGGVPAAYNTVVGNHLWQIPEYGILIQDGADFTTVRGNVVHQTGLGIRSDYACCQASAYVTIADNVVDNVTGSGNLGVGIMISGNSGEDLHGVIRNNHVSDVDSTGIRTNGGSDVLLQGNFVANAGRNPSGGDNSGILISSAETTVAGNAVHGSGQGIAIHNSATDTLLLGNDLTGNTNAFSDAGSNTQAYCDRLSSSSVCTDQGTRILNTSISPGFLIQSSSGDAGLGLNIPSGNNWSITDRALDGTLAILANSTSLVTLNRQGNLTANGTLQGTALVLNGDQSFSSSPRVTWSVPLIGALNTAWSGASLYLERGIVIDRIVANCKTPPAGCVTNAVVQLTDGVTPASLALTGTANDSGPLSVQYSAGATLTLSVGTAAAGCTTVPADVVVTVQYRMQ